MGMLIHRRLFPSCLGRFSHGHVNQVYFSVGKKIKADLLTGNAVVLFAYGLSGSGKTFTVFGPDAVDEPEVRLELHGTGTRAGSNIKHNVLCIGNGRETGEIGFSQTP